MPEMSEDEYWKTQKECPNCMEYNWDKNIEFVNRDDLVFLFDGFAYDNYFDNEDFDVLKKYEKLKKIFNIKVNKKCL